MPLKPLPRLTLIRATPPLNHLPPGPAGPVAAGPAATAVAVVALSAMLGTPAAAQGRQRFCLFARPQADLDRNPEPGIAAVAAGR